MSSMLSSSAPPPRIQFKQDKTLAERRELTQQLGEKYPGKIPVIVERLQGAKAPEMKKKKFLSPGDITVSKFLEEVRKQFQEAPAHNQTIIFMYANNTMLPNSASTMDQVYQDHRDEEDGLLYILYTGDNMFGF
ncbi:autophagy protein 8b [Pelomyxa schiedti]|nr:autophagy protein 8b [Pelomyxa schiedti]